MQNGFTVSPMRQEISLKAGDTYEGYIIVANPAEATADFNFVASVSPYSVKGEEYTADFATQSDRTQITKWIELLDSNGTLAPNEKTKVRFKITVPENAPAGGQYAMIGITSNREISGSTGVQNVIEMASLIYADVEGETVHGGEIKENYIPGFVTTGAPFTKVVLSNSGNVHETATAKITIKNIFTGEELVMDEINNNTYEIIVMPETTRELTRNLSGVSQLGIFEVSENVEYLGQVSSNSTVMVMCPIWFMVLTVALIASIIGMIGYGIHLRQKKSKKVVDF